MSLADFGITNESLHAQLTEQKARFLANYGWTEDVLIDYGIILRPNRPVFEAQDEGAGWNYKHINQLQGHNYADIVFRDLQGEPLQVFDPKNSRNITFRRARLLDFKGARGKYQSYRGVGVAIYLPQDLERPDYWVDLACDPGRPIMITEGEFDAISAHHNGLPCLGITGVDCFMLKGGKKIATPADRIEWYGREVHICFDQDPESTVEQPHKQSVLDGLTRLSVHLSLLGATVYLLNITVTPVGRAKLGEKIGLSEYFKYGGTNEDLLKTKTVLANTEVPLARVLIQYANHKGDVLDLHSGDLYSFTKWSNMVAPLRMKIEDKLVEVSKLWRVHKLRADVDEFVFDSAYAHGLIPGTKQFNIWHGWATRCGESGDPLCDEGVEIFETLGERLWGAELWSWVRGCLAHLLQRPEEGRHHVLILQSAVGGTGKSAFFRLIGQIIGPDHFVSMQPNRFFSQFNHLAAGKLMILFDEVHIKANQQINQLKDQVASDTIVIEGKGVDSTILPWRGLICMSTNEDFAIRTKGTERRYCQATPAITVDQVYKWQEWLHPALTKVTTDKNAPRRREGIMAWLMREEWLDDYDPLANAPVSSSMLTSMEASMSDRDYTALRLFDTLPEVFAFTPANRSGYGIGSVDKYIVDLVLSRAKLLSNASANVRIGGNVHCVTIYSKYKILPVKIVGANKRIDGDKARLLFGLGPADLVRRALEGTDEVLKTFTVHTTGWEVDETSFS